MKIRTKYSLMTAALIGSVVIAIGASVTQVQRRELEAQSRRRLDAVMEGVERIAQESINGHDDLMLISYLMFLQKERPELAHAAVTRHGHTSDLGSERPGLLYLTRSLAQKRPAAAGADSLIVKIGFLKAALDLELDRALKPLIARTMAIAGTFMFLGVLASFGLSRLLTGPLITLSAAVEEVGHGNLDISVTAKRDDEVGTLAKRFNEMTGRIKELLEFREDILRTLSHEINTPLAGLKGYIELWQNRPEGVGENRVDVLQTMSSAVLRMENSLGSALRLFKTSANSPEASQGECRVVWLDQVFGEVLTLYAPVAQSKKVELQRLPGDWSMFVYGEEEALSQIANNLVSNALKYTPTGGKVLIGAKESDTEASFWVTDSGYGISKEDIPHLFTKFYRTKAGHTKERIPGTGLGLSIMHKAVESMRGVITVESEVGKGSTFKVSIPKVKGA